MGKAMRKAGLPTRAAALACLLLGLLASGCQAETAVAGGGQTQLGWLQRAALPETPQMPGGDATRGAEYLEAYGCTACHTIPGIPKANALVGPPLTGWAERVYIAGALPNTPANLILWIQEPQTVEPGTAMPDLGVTEQVARDMGAYLYTLVGEGGG